MTTIRLFVKALLFAVFAFFIVFISGENITQIKQDFKQKEDPGYPAEWFYLQRSYPDAVFDIKAYQRVMAEAREKLNTKSGLPGFNAPWTLEGPLNINGRMNCIAVHPQNSNVIFAGSASGGIFKTINGGLSWTPVFDSYAYLGVGDITFHPQNPQIIYAGTGDPNISGYPFIGEGVFKSTNGGQTWNYCGLANTYITSRICINPLCPDTVYAATMGLPFLRDNNRGLYMSTNGGQTWTQKLFISNQSGIIDLIVDPVNPNILYAAGWDRIRNNQESVVSGPAAKIYKSTNAGNTWNQLSNGLPATDMSRIGLCMSAQNNQVLYASYVSPFLELGGIYKTTDGGQNWTSVDISSLPGNSMGGFGWYFGQIRVNPTNDNQLYLLGVDLWRKPSATTNWEMAAPPWDTYIVHADKHDMILLNNNTFLLAADGGLYKTVDGGQNWTDIDKTPTAQFYRVNTNPHEPGVYYGGAQDNGTICGNAAQINNWQRVLGGDGFQPLFDPYDPFLCYYEMQNGALYFDDGFGFYDFTYGIDPTDRRSWDMPVIMSAFNNQRMYTGTYRVYKITDAPYGTWLPISNDLTDGVIYGDRFHVITTVAESPLNQNYLYAGTSDGNVWRSLNGGTTWNNVTGSLPDRYVTHIVASPTNPNTVYVAHSGYKSNDFIPHIHKSSNNGNTWVDISGNLPQFAINNIEILPGYNDNIIFVATDGGVYATINGGISWNRLGSNMPLVTVYDIVYDTAFNKLIAGTLGRAMHSYNLDSLIQYYQFVTGETHHHDSSPTLVFSPNPASDMISAEINFLSENIKSVEVYDLKGNKYFPGWKKEGEKLTVDLSSLAGGVYLISVCTERRKHIHGGKIIKL